MSIFQVIRKFFKAGINGLMNFSSKGRASRFEFWALIFCEVLAYSIVGVIVLIDAESLMKNWYVVENADSTILGLMIAFAIAGWFYIFTFVWLIAFCFCSARRAHDCNLTGYLWLLILVPFVGLPLLGLLSGDKGENRYGAALNNK